MRFLALSLLLLEIAGCSHEQPATTNSSTKGTAAGQQVQQADARDTQLLPNEIIYLMGGNLTGMTVADLFADDGYFAFKFVAAGAKVIAVVNDNKQAKAIEAKKKAMGISNEQLQVRVAPVGDPGIKNGEADMGFIFHRFVGIADKGGYFTKMREGLRYPRMLMMLEWKYENSSDGPPLSERMTENDIMDFVGTTGYSDVGAHSAKVPGHVIFMINDYMDVPPADAAPAPGQ